jgi:DNA-binding CsgD family transcriptional regulator
MQPSIRDGTRQDIRTDYGFAPRMRVRQSIAVTVPASLRRAGVTAREAEVLDALSARMTNAEIAERLVISVRTVESHVSALLAKLDEPDRRALAVRARSLFQAEPLPLAASLVASTSDRLVGRASELKRLAGLAERTRGAGVRRLALITGEAGIGKTRVAAEAAAGLHAAGAIVVHGRCQQDALIPYQAFLEAARPLGIDEQISRPAAEAGGDARFARYRRFEEFDRLLASQRALVVFVLDDIQWIDPSGLQLLRHVLHHVDRSPALVIATGRPEVANPRQMLAAVLESAQAADALEIIELQGLSLQEAEALAGSFPIVDSGWTRAAWQRTGGNPFLLSELLRHARPEGELPPTARDAIVRRIAGLGPTVFEVLAAAAVFGEVFGHDVVIAALGGDAQAHAAALERAFGAGLVLEDSARRGEYRFAHAIVREALLAITSPSHRSRLHLKVAETLAAHGGPGVASDVARHRHAALPDGDPHRARLAALEGFEHAMSAHAYEVAISLADMALDAIEAGGGSESERADALLRRARAQIKTGDLERGISDCRLVLGLANRHDLPRLRAEAVLGWADASAVWARQPELRAALERVLEEHLDDLALQAQLKARLAQVLYYEDAHERRLQLSRAAVDDARRTNQPHTLASVLATTHSALWEPSQLDQRIGVASQVVDIAVSTGQPELEALGLGWLAVDRLEAGDVRGADSAFERHAVLAERLQQRLALRDVELWAAMRAMLDGRFDDASERVERARDLGETARDPSAETIYWVQRYWLALERGSRADTDDVVGPCTRFVNDNTDVPAWRAAVAMLHARRGDHKAARPHYELLAANGFRTIPRDDVSRRNVRTPERRRASPFAAGCPDALRRSSRPHRPRTGLQGVSPPLLGPSRLDGWADRCG